ncbi:hypothetical protein WAI453_004460 [Rhynchosporium graminicola]
MTSTQPTQPSSDSSPPNRRTNSSTFSTSNRFSNSTSETGESSRPASQRNSLRASNSIDQLPHDARAGNRAGMESLEGNLVNDGRGSHRSHRSRNNGGFLLSNAVFEAQSEIAPVTSDGMMRQRHSRVDGKGKGASKNPEILHRKKRSNMAGSVGGSPLAANVLNAGSATGSKEATNANDGVESQVHETAKGATTGLDVDSKQIVNLALNLSESRRNAQRRVISTPLPPITNGLGEPFTGGSLRHHLQAQRRVSRNVSPKPDRGERTMTASPRSTSGQWLGSPLQASNEEKGQYRYTFSASTLARAEKAKTTIELMAQYRRLLQFVPPLRPLGSEKGIAVSRPGTSSGSSVVVRTISNTSSNRTLGRPYNPLQYIRNRKVRSRNSKAIDGEAQGFGDLEKVSTWVDTISHRASSEDSQNGDCLTIPHLSNAADESSPFGSPRSSLGKSHGAPVKVKRPRIDWVTNPADMIADIFWLEQEDNKKLIEDRHGRRIFPPSAELKRPGSRRSEEPDIKKASPKAKADDLGIDMRMLVTKLPEFKSVKEKPESDVTPSRTRQKLRDVRAATRLHGGHRHLSSRSRSDDSDLDDSDDSVQPRSRRGVNVTEDGLENGKVILEKQMIEILKREEEESRSASRETSGQSNDTESLKRAPKDISKANGSAGHNRSGSSVKDSRASAKANSSGRASLEVPRYTGRASMDDLNTTAPNSPETRPSKLGDRFVPSIAMDSSPGGSRPTSPSRGPLSIMRSKIRPLYDRGHESGGHHHDEDGLMASIEHDQESPEPRRRSMSPVKRLVTRVTDETQKSVKKAGSIKRGKEDSGIRGLFKRNNPVSRVSDLLWRKESSPGPGHGGNSSGFSTDESDIEEIRDPIKGVHSRDSSVGTLYEDADEVEGRGQRRRHMNGVPPLPSFTSPFERRGRSERIQSDDSNHDPNANTRSRLLSTREERKNTPRIDVHTASPTSSPETYPLNRHRDSSVSASDIDSRRNSVAATDARLNSILGLPRKRRNALPIAGLSSLEASNNQPRRPSMQGRQWSISDRSPSVHRGPMNKREIARVRALLLSSGIKAKEISRRAAELKDIRTEESPLYGDIAEMIPSDLESEITPVPKSQQHRLAARLISSDIQTSSQLHHSSASHFLSSTIPSLHSRISTLQQTLINDLTPTTRKAADEADEVSKDLVALKMLEVKSIGDKIDKMTRTRRRRFRWLRRGGWVVVEWVLVGVMWYVWALVVLLRALRGCVGGVVEVGRWLLWL